MKYVKLITFFLLLISFTLLSADDLIKPDNEAITPDNEPLRIDLESIKKDIEAKKNTSKTEKKADVKSGKSKSGEKSVVKKTKVKKNKKESKPVKKKIKSNQKMVNRHEKKSKSAEKIPEVKKIETGKVNTEAEKTDKSFKSDILSGKNDIIPENTEAKPDKKESGSAKTGIIAEKSDIIIINPSAGDLTLSRLYCINYAGIAKWGKPQGVKIRDDAPPVIDGMAFYMPDYSAEFRVEGYDRERNYRLYIDFVKFDGKFKPLNSILKIWGRGPSGKMFLFAEINQDILYENKIFETLIPYELSSTGRFDIIVREYSDMPGKWGIWDMIVTDKSVDRIEIIRPGVPEKMREIEPKIFK